MTAVAEPKSDTQQISLLTQMVRFIVVGGFSALVDFGVYNLCLHVFGLEAAAHGADLSRAISFICGTTTAYLLNRRWTFSATDSTAARIRYLAVQLGGLAASTLTLWALVRGIGLGRTPGELLAVPAVTVLMFAANRGWTFAAGLPDAPASARIASWSSG